MKNQVSLNQLPLNHYHIEMLTDPK